MNSKRIFHRSKEDRIKAKLIKLLQKARTRNVLLVKETQLNPLPDEISDRLRNARTVNELGNALADALDQIKIEIDISELLEIEENESDLDHI